LRDAKKMQNTRSERHIETDQTNTGQVTEQGKVMGGEAYGCVWRKGCSKGEGNTKSAQPIINFILRAGTETLTSQFCREQERKRGKG